MNKLILIIFTFLPVMASAQMTTVYDTVQATGDDGYIKYADVGLVTVTAYDNAGYSTQSFDALVRHPDIVVPAGVIVDSCFMRFRLYGLTGTPAIRIFMEDTASSVFPTNYTDFTNKHWTTAYVDWNLSGLTANSWNETPNLATIVQEVVDRADYASGGDLLFRWDDYGNGATNIIQIYDRSDAAANASQVRIVYHEPTGNSGAKKKKVNVSIIEGDNE